MTTIITRSIRVQSISDIITNSSSEVFLVSKERYNPPTGYDSYAYKVDFEFLCHNYDREFVYDYLEIPDILDDVYFDPSHPEQYYDDNDPYSEKNQYYIDLLREYIKENQEKFDSVLDSYLVFVSDHDPDTYAGDCTEYNHTGHLLGHA